MRYCLFCGISFGFLALIAFSWHAPGIESAPPVTHVAEVSLLPNRAPASTPNSSLAEINRLRECYRSQSCDVPHSDAVSYRRAVSEALAIALAEHLGNFGADASLARSAVQNPEPIVQAVGLSMLSALPPSAESLSALGNGLRDSSDPALVAGSVLELRRYLGTHFETDAQRIVEELVGYGAISGQAQALVSPFVNEHSYDEFREVLAHLDTGADAARLLRSVLDQYESHRR
jgi:hypothetical protein